MWKCLISKTFLTLYVIIWPISSYDLLILSLFKLKFIFIHRLTSMTEINLVFSSYFVCILRCVKDRRLGISLILPPIKGRNYCYRNLKDVYKKLFRINFNSLKNSIQIIISDFVVRVAFRKFSLTIDELSSCIMHCNHAKHFSLCFLKIANKMFAMWMLSFIYATFYFSDKSSPSTQLIGGCRLVVLYVCGGSKIYIYATDKHEISS